MGVKVEGRVAETLERRESRRRRRVMDAMPPRGSAPLGRAMVSESLGVGGEGSGVAVEKLGWAVSSRSDSSSLTR